MSIQTNKCEVHQFIRKGPRSDKTRSGNTYFICAAPDCYTTYERKALIGKYSLCNVCGTRFNLSYDDLKRAKPRCISCSKTKKGETFRRSQSIANKLFEVTDPETEKELGEGI